jgi:hypothetical protein
MKSPERNEENAAINYLVKNSEQIHLRHHEIELHIFIIFCIIVEFSSKKITMPDKNLELQAFSTVR